LEGGFVLGSRFADKTPAGAFQKAIVLMTAPDFSSVYPLNERTGFSSG
jgi:hypothetical protein